MTKNNETKTVQYYVIEQDGKYLSTYKQNSEHSMAFTATWTSQIEFAAKGYPMEGQEDFLKNLATLFEGELVPIETTFKELPTGTELDAEDTTDVMNQEAGEAGIEDLKALTGVLGSFIDLLGGGK